MGLFGTYRYHEPWEPVDEEVAAQCGQPAYSLFMVKKEIRDAKDQTLYYEDAKFLSVRYKTDIYDAKDQLVAHYERVPLSWHYRYYIQMDDGTALELYKDGNELTIEPGSWIVRMDGFAVNCTLVDAEGRVLAFIGQKKWSMSDRYCIDVYEPEAERFIVAIAAVIRWINYQADLVY